MTDSSSCLLAPMKEKSLHCTLSCWGFITQRILHITKLFQLFNVVEIRFVKALKLCLFIFHNFIVYRFQFRYKKSSLNYDTSDYSASWWHARAHIWHYLLIKIINHARFGNIVYSWSGRINNSVYICVCESARARSRACVCVGDKCDISLKLQ